MAHRTPGPGGARAGPLHPDSGADRCAAVVRLHGSLQRSLAAAGGRRVGIWQHCVLRRDHEGAHLAAAYQHGAAPGWLGWDDSGFRVGGTSPLPSGPRRMSPTRTNSAAARRDRRFAARSTRAAPGVAAGVRAGASDTSRPGSSERDDRTAALWAIAAAVNRLADMIAAGDPRGWTLG